MLAKCNTLILYFWGRNFAYQLLCHLSYKENFTRQKGENTLLVSNIEILMQIIDYVCATRVEEPMKQSKDW